MSADFVLLKIMQPEISSTVHPVTLEINSGFLERKVRVDFYLPEFSSDQPIDLMLVNDGQDLVTMDFRSILDDLVSSQQIHPILAVGIHCGEDRKNEYGMLVSPDYAGRGSKAKLYEQFIFEELLPSIRENFPFNFRQKVFAGFSLGALSAFDLVWNHPEMFSAAAVFSGSFWWRSKDKIDKNYNEWADRLMHRQIKNDAIRPGMRFFFECGALDESEDRNNNGVIDSIDDTLDVIRLLVNKGYEEGRDIRYLQVQDGRHDVPTWSRAFPEFLKWQWRKQ